LKRNINFCFICSGKNRGKTPTCNCLNGFYSMGRGDCLPCPPKCGNCILKVNNITNQSTVECLTCKGLFRNADPPECTCVNTHYDDDVNSNCRICPPNCKTCSDANTCLSCYELPPLLFHRTTELPQWYDFIKFKYL
jgi:proprotein convertase subtilisin/kexin type 5